MFTWLKNIYNGSVGALSTIEKWIMGALNAVYSYFGALISQVFKALQQLSSSVTGYIDRLEGALTNLYSVVQHIITSAIPDAVHWAEGELSDLRNYAVGVYNWAISQLGKLAALAESDIAKALQWVIKNVYDPIEKDLTGALHWISNEGAYAYNLLTHPDLVADMVGHYILQKWLGWGQKYSKIFIKWLLHNIMNEIPTIGSIVEDIISSLF